MFMEDVYTTGMCAEKCQLIRYDNPGITTEPKTRGYWLKVIIS